MIIGKEGMEHARQERLEKYRRIMDRIHEGGSIYYDAGRMQAYGIIAKIASDERRRTI